MGVRTVMMSAGWSQTRNALYYMNVTLQMGGEPQVGAEFTDRLTWLRLSPGNLKQQAPKWKAAENLWISLGLNIFTREHLV